MCQRIERLSGYQNVFTYLDSLMTSSPVRIGTPSHFAVPTMMRSCSSGTSSTSAAARTTSALTGTIS